MAPADPRRPSPVALKEGGYGETLEMQGLVRVSLPRSTLLTLSCTSAGDLSVDGDDELFGSGS